MCRRRPVAIGYIHNLSKRTSLYATGAVMDNEANGALTVPGGPAGMRRGESSKGAEAGIRHIF